MIEKIDARAILDKALSRPFYAQKGDPGDFQLLLKEKVAEPLPLERIALEFLKKAVDSILSGDDPERGDPFPGSSLVLPSFFSPLQNIPPAPRPPENHPIPPGSPPKIEVSNNLPYDYNFESIVQDAGHRYGIDPSLIKAVIQAESGGNPLTVSKAGAQGLMQIMPATAAELGVANPFDPTQNVMGGTRYLRKLLDRYHGDTRLALAAYNWGMGNLEKRPEAIPKETQKYIAQVENLYRNYSGA